MPRRHSLLALVSITAVTLAVGAAACSGGGGGGAAVSPSPSGTPFVASHCQLVWTKKDPATQTRVIDYYVVDAPAGKWVTGTNSYFIGDPSGVTNVEGAFVYHFDVVALSNMGAAVASSGIFSVGTNPADPTGIGKLVGFQDSTPQHYFTLTSAGLPNLDQGPGGTGDFTGQWSNPGSPDVTAGTGSMNIMFMGTSFSLGGDLAYGMCFPSTAFAAMSRDERLLEAGRRAGKYLQTH